MRNIALAALAGLAAISLGQTKAMEPFDYHASNVRLLEHKTVQKELAITEAQRKKMNKHADAHRQRLKAYEDKKRAQGQRIDAPDAELLGIMEELKKGVLSELNATQLRRLRELSLQQVGLVAVLDEKVAAKVGIDAPLLKKLRETYVAGSKEANSMIRTELNKVLANYQSAKPKNDAEKKELQERAKANVEAAEKRLGPHVEKIRTETRNKMLAMMTAQQKSAFLALQGKKITS